MQTRTRSLITVALLTGALALASSAMAQSPDSITASSAPPVVKTQPLAVQTEAITQASASEAPKVGFLKRFATKAATLAVIGTAKGLDAVTGATKAATSAVDASACTGPLPSTSQCVHYVKTEIEKASPNTLRSSPDTSAPVTPRYDPPLIE